MDRGAWQAAVHRVAESAMTERLSTHAWLSFLIQVMTFLIVVCESHSVVSDSSTPWTVVCQAPLSMEFSRPEYWRG